MIEKIGRGVKALLLGLIGPILAAIACTLLASWIKALRELLASIKAVIKAFLLKIFKAIKDWLLGKSGKGGQGAACALPVRPKPKGGKPKKPKGKGVACGNCFAARTLVQCPDGMQPIETIRVGQRVTTFSASDAVSSSTLQKY